MRGEAAHGVGPQARAQGGQQQAGVTVLAGAGIEKIAARGCQRTGRVGFEAQGFDRCGQGLAAEVFAGQQLAAGHVPAQGAEDDVETGFTRVAAMVGGEAFEFEHQGETFEPGLTGIQPAAETREQAADAEQQGFHLFAGGRQGEAAGEACRRDEPRAWVGRGAVGAVEQIGDGLGVAPGEAVARQAADVGQSSRTDAGKERQVVGVGDCRAGAVR